MRAAAAKLDARGSAWLKARAARAKRKPRAEAGASARTTALRAAGAHTRTPLKSALAMDAGWLCPS
eukprot:5734909-Amphidinium_carterae.2